MNKKIIIILSCILVVGVGTYIYSNMDFEDVTEGEVIVNNVKLIEEDSKLIENVKERYGNGYFKEVDYYEKVIINDVNNEILVMKRIFYINGQIEEEIKYKDGEKNGIYKKYWDNGQIRTEGNFIDGLPNGKWVDYISNGDIHTKSEWLEGRQHGERIYYKNGKISIKSIYENGNLINKEEY